MPTVATRPRLQRRLLLLAATTTGAAALPLAGCDQGARRANPASAPAAGTAQRPARAPDPFDSDASPRR